MDIRSLIAFTTDNWIALLAAAIALLSALYSRWAVKEAQRANLIAIHQFKREFYEAYEQLLDKIATHRLTEEHVQAFQIHVNLAEVYLPNELAKNVGHFHDRCWDLMEAQVAHSKAAYDQTAERLRGLTSRATNEEDICRYDDAKAMLDTCIRQKEEAQGRALDDGIYLGERLRRNMRLVR